MRPPCEAEPGDHLRLLDILVTRIGKAAAENKIGILVEAERCFAELTGADAEIIVNSAGQWRRWQHLEVATDDAEAPEAAPSVVEAGRLVLPIRPDAIAVVLEDDGGPGLAAALGILAGCVALAVDLGAARSAGARSASELDVLHAVATRILETQTLDDILLLVSHEAKRLLSADICGVMMREGDEVVMKSCVGHFSPVMPRLRMQSGIGVAGHVLATGKPCVVGNYVESHIITRDFIPLARAEKVRSALAVPILSRESFIGVLEVWRRRPTAFKEEDTQLLVALAGLTAVAIDNALLLRAHVDAAERLSAAYSALEERYAVITSTAEFQERVAALMLVDHSLPRILDLTSEFTDATILFLDAGGRLECAVPAAGRPEDEVIRSLAARLTKPRRDGGTPFTLPLGERLAYVLPVTSGVEPLGALVWLGSDDPTERVRLALRHVSLAAGLYCYERRRAARERISTLESVMWALFEGDLGVRAVAYERAAELRVQIRDHVFVAILALPALAATEKDDDPVRHERILAAAGENGLGFLVLMAGIRGNRLCLLCKGHPDGSRMASLDRLRTLLQGQSRGEQIPLGLSTTHTDWRSLPAAYREAVVAAEVASHRRRNPVVHYGQTGIMGLLVNLHGKADLRRVGGEILGGLLSEAEPNRRVLMDTLEAYFDCECSQLATAGQLNVHSKTVAYRLEKIGAITGLNLSRHQDRVLADIGIRMLALIDEA